MNIKKFENRSDFACAMMDKYFKNLPNSVVSDIGSGWGNMRGPIEARGYQWQPFDYVTKIKESIMWDLNNPVSENTNSAGGVIFLEVLEHLANPELGLKNIYNHMEKGGILILSTPNPQSSVNVLHLLIKGVLYAFQPKHLIERHVFTPWEHIVTFFLENLGFEILEYAIVDTQYQKLKPNNLKSFIKRKIEQLIEWRNPKSIGMSYGLVVRKK